MHNKPITFAVVAFLIAVGLSQVATAADKSGDVIDHTPLTELLSAYVDKEGQVDYDGWHDNKEAMEKLDDYVGEIEDASVEDYTKESRLAFYLNAYNALVLDSVLEEWPIDSPKSVEGFFKQKKHTVADQSMSLDWLEHELIRPKFAEPRIHFVLVCAAKSCPRLRTEALTAETLEETLESAAREFVSSATSVEESSQGDEQDDATQKVVTSKLFDWFAEDFIQSEGSVRRYLLKYVEGDVADALERDADISFREYDWSINNQ